MLQATFNHLKDRSAYVATFDGHAAFADIGKDVVCAGASMFIFGLTQCVIQMGESGKLQKKPNIQLGDGSVFIVAKPKPEHELELRNYFYMAQVGMKLLQDSYPANVSLQMYETFEKKEE